MDNNGFTGSQRVLTSIGNMYIKDLFQICDNKEQFYFNNRYFKGYIFVRSIYGHDDIAKVIYIGKMETIRLSFEDEFSLEVTPNYILMTENQDEIKTSESLGKSINCYFRGLDVFLGKKVTKVESYKKESIYNIITQNYNWIIVNNVVVSTLLNFFNINDDIELSNDHPDLKDLIFAGEGSKTEFKSSLRWDFYQNKINKELELEVAKTICGFANKKGGYLFIGVKNDGSILGLENDYKTLGNKKDKDGFLLYLDNVIQNFLGDEIHALLDIKIEKIEDREICLIRINKGQNPIYIENSDFYIRRSSSTKKLNPKEAVDYVKSHFF